MKAMHKDRGWRTKIGDENRSLSSFIPHPSSPILHPSFTGSPSFFMMVNALVVGQGPERSR